MSMNLIIVGTNGQLEFDFASLEALTSAKFVDFIQKRLMGLDYGGKIVSYEIVYNSDRAFVIRILENWISNGGGHAAYSVYEYAFGKKYGTCEETFRSTLSGLNEKLTWAIERGGVTYGS